MANQIGMVFSKLNCKPRWRERLSELAREIPDATSPAEYVAPS